MTVFANGLEISSKAQACKVIAAFPDTCFTPPQTPATPPGVPIPYPDFGQDSDVTSGSSTVTIGGKEVSQENSSKYSKCSGDEAGVAPKKGIVTSKNTGAVYAQKWSMDVKVEDKGVVRFSDIATSNHACNPGDSPPMIYAAAMNLPSGACDAFNAEWMTTYRANECPPGHQAHHIVDNCSFARRGSPAPGEPSWRSMPRNRFSAADLASAAAAGREWVTLRNQFLGNSAHPGVDYNDEAAPCICLEDGQSEDAGHRCAHDSSRAEAATRATDGIWTYKDAREAALQSMIDLEVFDSHQLQCIALALKKYYEDELGCTETTELVSPPGSVPNRPLRTGHGNATAAQSPAPVLG
jgi:hypothetical protein